MRPIMLKALAIGLASFMLMGGSAAAQPDLAKQFKNNLATLAITVKQESGGVSLTITVIGGVAVAVKSTPTETFWLTEPENVFPQVVSGLPGEPQIEIRLQGQDRLLEVVRRFEHFVVLREPAVRQIVPIQAGANLKVGDSVTVLTLEEEKEPKEQTATVTQVDSSRGLFALSAYLDREASEAASSHGAPIFVLRDGQARLAGLYVGHERAKAFNAQGWGAGAFVPDVEQLLKERSRVLNSNEYRLVQAFTGDVELELHNVQEPKNAKNVRVTVQARINFLPQTLEAMMDIANGRGTKTIRLGRQSDQIEVQQVAIRY